jgi:hypothetical protein
VDAKILNVHDPALPREAYVGYLVEDSGLSNARRSTSIESDDAEVDAVMFAVEDLRGKFEKMTIVCDHESVVSEALREDPGSQNDLMKALRQLLRENEWVKLEVLKSNPAHRVVTEYVNRVKGT